MKVLVTGAAGMLGRELTEVLSLEGHAVEASDVHDLDICVLEAVWARIADCRPDVVVNCAAYTDVDGCETQRYMAYAVNAIGPKNLAIVTHGLGIPLVHISTDYVFDGEAGTPYVESDFPNPLNVYGKSKLAGERNVQIHNPKHFIVRTQWLYGRHGKNFVQTMLSLAKTRDVLTVVDDQFGKPTYARDLAAAIEALISSYDYGLYHITNRGWCSWYDFAKVIMATAKITIDVRPCTTAEFPRPATRPKYSVLENMNFWLCGFEPLRGGVAALKEFLDTLR